VIPPFSLGSNPSNKNSKKDLLLIESRL